MEGVPTSIAYRDPRRELFNTLKEETGIFLDSIL